VDDDHSKGILYATLEQVNGLPYYAKKAATAN
jgi:hypothetical protein